MFTDSVGNYLTPDVKVYDKIEKGELKYVSVIFRLKENYLSDDESFDELRSLTVPLLLTRFPEKTFVGRLQYVYQSGGSMQARTIPLDWRHERGSEIE